MYLVWAMEIPCPTCPTWSHFIQDKLKIFIYLSLDKYKCIKLIQFCISYFDKLLWTQYVALKTVWILIRAGFWRSQLILIYTVYKRSQLIRIHTFNKRFDIWFHTVFERVHFGHVKFSLDKYIMAIYLSLDNRDRDKKKSLQFPHPWFSSHNKYCMGLVEKTGFRSGKAYASLLSYKN